MNRVKDKYNKNLRIKLSPEENWSVIQAPPEMRQHLYMAFICDWVGINPMKDIIITPEDLKNQIKKTKRNKAPGSDGLKSDFLKITEESEICLDQLSLCFSNVIEDEIVSDGWMQTNTKFTQKKRKENLQWKISDQ